jgi:hypothetical protein
MPSLTPLDALIHEADNLTDTITGLIPTSTVTADAVDQLMEICKQQARATRDAATAQRLLREHAQAERVIKEECQQDQAAPPPTFQVDDGNDIAPAQQAIPQITQDKYDSSPATNTHQQLGILTLTQDFMLQCMEIPGYTAPFTPQQAASRRYPLQLLYDLAYAVLDDKTDDLIEYRHSMKHPKYKDIWTKPFSKEIVKPSFLSTKQRSLKNAGVMSPNAE